MPEHTSMLFLPDALRAAGINVIELDGWKEAQGNYFWTDLPGGHQGYGEEPTCFMIHHTATTAANPSVKDSSGTWSKANCWAGLWRDGRLYQSGGGVPTVVFTAAGPARVSSGYGHGPTLHEVGADVRVPYRQTAADTDMAANRYAWNVETVAAGNGSAIDPGVQHALVVMGALLCNRFDWSPWRTIGHLTWTRRKVDPWWDGQQDIIVTIQDAVAEYMNDDGPIPPPIGDDMWNEWVIGLVEGYAEDPAFFQTTLERWVVEGKFHGNVSYWVTLLEQPENAEWRGFVSRTIFLGVL